VTIVGEEGLSDLDRRYLEFADEFERKFVGQRDEDRSIDETLDLGLDLLKSVPEREAVRRK
jgi:V/A-type H+-transporting ATPase subunit B